MSEATILDVRHLEVRYGALVAVRDLSLSVAPGETVAVLGPNGAGKSTLLRAISGLLRPSAGTIHVDGKDVTRASPVTPARRTLAHVLEGRGIFADLSVAENLAVAARAVPSGMRADELRRVQDHFPVLARRHRQSAGSLSGGEQQQLAIARALMQRPRLLLLDEMSLGLAPRIVDDLFGVLRDIRASGTAILLVEQYVTRALDVADRAVVLEKGEMRREGPAAELRNSAELTATYLGDTALVPAGAVDATESITVEVPAQLARQLADRAHAAGTTPAGFAARAVAAHLEGLRE